MIKANLLQHIGTDTEAAYSAWVSTARDIDRTEKDAIDLVNRLADDEHTSCFEHQVATFELHVPIFIARQIMRHRIFSYNELSGRYKDMRSQDIYVSEISNHKEKLIKHYEQCKKLYTELRKSGESREIARQVLPLSLMTRIKMTGNLRSWSHFIKLRDSEHAQFEIRLLAKDIRKQLEQIWPISCDALMK